MTAREMFETLGYAMTESPFKDIIEYGSYFTGSISFDKTYEVFYTNVTVGVELHRAITCQMIELGWFE